MLDVEKKRISGGRHADDEPARAFAGLLGVAALAGMPFAVRAAEGTVPPEGIGHRIKHVSYSDIGGRPDSVQVMSSRDHLYVGHMFSDGVTILDASDPAT